MCQQVKTKVSFPFQDLPGSPGDKLGPGDLTIHRSGRWDWTREEPEDDGRRAIISYFIIYENAAPVVEWEFQGYLED